MRQDRRQRRTASDVVNGYPADDLARVLRAYGDERFATRIARAIVAARPLATTTELAEVVRTAIPAPARRTGGHPAKRTFQAVRIEVNEELAILADSIDQAIDFLAPGGRCAVLSYHSGEDRIVKERFRHHATGGVEPLPGLPLPNDVEPAVRLVRGVPKTPRASELAANPRSESARLRVVERLPRKAG
jgi:16S rRNA (cytosine1402-N4)-methyltransferase